MLSHIWLFVTPWTIACQAPLSMTFSRQEYWSVLPCLPPGDCPNPEMEPASCASPPLVGGPLPLAPPGKPTFPFGHTLIKRTAYTRTKRLDQSQPRKTWESPSQPTAAATAKSLQSCPTLYNRIDGSPPGSSVHGILQARTLEWVAISFSNAWKWKWSHSVVSNSKRPHGLQPTRLLRPWDFPGKSTGVGCHCFLLINHI